MRNRSSGCILGCPGCEDSLKHYLWCSRLGQLVAFNSGLFLENDALRRLALVHPSEQSLRRLVMLFHTHRLLHAEANKSGLEVIPPELCRIVGRTAKTVTDLVRG